MQIKLSKESVYPKLLVLYYTISFEKGTKKRQSSSEWLFVLLEQFFLKISSNVWYDTSGKWLLQLRDSCTCWNSHHLHQHDCRLFWEQINRILG
jgi:hypothetical protein